VFTILKNRRGRSWFVGLAVFFLSFSLVGFLVWPRILMTEESINVGHSTMICMKMSDYSGFGPFHNAAPKLWAYTYLSPNTFVDFRNEWGFRLFHLRLSVYLP